MIVIAVPFAAQAGGQQTTAIKYVKTHHPVSKRAAKLSVRRHINRTRRGFV